MQKDTIFSIIRVLLNLAGSFLVGKHIFGTTLDSTSWEIWVGAILTLGATAWGIFDKSATSEKIASALRSVVTSVGGLFVAAGKLSGQTLEAILGLIGALAPIFQSNQAKQTVAGIASGKLVATDSGKAMKAVA